MVIGCNSKFSGETGKLSLFILHATLVFQGGVEKKIAPTATKKERGEEAPMPRTVRGLPQTERHFCRCYACGWSCWFGASDWTCWSKPVRAICGGSCCFGARSTPVRAIWTAESFPSTLSLSWLWRGALRSCLLMASSTGSGNESDSLAYTRRPLAFIPGTSHFAFLLLTCASAEE